MTPMCSIPSLRRALLTIAGLLPLALAACDDYPTTVSMRRIEDPWSVAQGAGLLPVVVRGRPAFASDEAVAEDVLHIVRQTITWTASPPLIGETGGNAHTGRRLVYVFNAEGADPCAPEPLGGEPLPLGRVTLSAGFCDGQEMLSRVDGRVGRSEGLDSRPLVRLIGQATRELLAPPPAPRP
jgi:hypothetical protein